MDSRDFTVPSGREGHLPGVDFPEERSNFALPVVRDNADREENSLRKKESLKEKRKSRRSGKDSLTTRKCKKCLRTGKQDNLNRRDGQESRERKFLLRGKALLQTSGVPDAAAPAIAEWNGGQQKPRRSL